MFVKLQENILVSQLGLTGGATLGLTSGGQNAAEGTTGRSNNVDRRWRHDGGDATEDRAKRHGAEGGRQWHGSEVRERRADDDVSRWMGVEAWFTGDEQGMMKGKACRRAQMPRRCGGVGRGQTIEMAMGP
jgi:hypothetical protein